MIPASCAGLFAAIKVAVTAITIGLPAGNCAIGVVKGYNLPAPVTITSADPAHPAVITSIDIYNSSNLTFTGLGMTFTSANDGYYAFRFDTVKSITFDHVTVHGADLTLAPGAQLTAFYFNNAVGLSFTNSQVHDASLGLLVSNSSNVTVSGNAFSRLSKGGVAMAAVTNASVIKNAFTDFYPAVGVHPDAIQGWTAGTKTASSNVKITDNIIQRGAGVPVQGVLIQDEAGGLPWANVDIERNLITGMQWNSIRVDGYAGKLNMANNVAVSWTGSANDGTAATSGFYGVIFAMTPAPGAVLTQSGNTAQGYVIGTKNGAPAGNSQLPAIGN